MQLACASPQPHNRIQTNITLNILNQILLKLLSVRTFLKYHEITLVWKIPAGFNALNAGAMRVRLDIAFPNFVKILPDHRVNKISKG